MVQLSFKQTRAEIMVRIASTLLFNQLVKANSRIVSVREITENIQYGYTEKATASEIGPKYVRITDLKDGRVNWDTVPYCECHEPEQYLLKQNDLLFARTGATTGKTHLFRDEPPYAVFASYLIRVRPTKEINPEYLYYFFQSDLYWSQVSSHKEGSAQPNVNGQKLSVIELPITTEEIQKAVCRFLAVVRARQDGIAQELPELPQPLTEQRRIVAHIEALAARVNEAQRLREEAIEESRVLLNSASAECFKKIKTWRKLGDHLFDLIYRYPTFYNVIFTDSGVGLLKISNLTQQDWIIDFETKKEFIDEETSKRFPQTILESGDLVMAVRGATIGKTAYVSKEYVGFNINANLLRMKPNQKILDGKFFWYFMKSQTGQNQFQQLVTSTAKQTITVPKLKTIEVPVPSLDEQREIVSYLDGLQIQLEQLRNLQDESQSELDALMPSVLDKAFKGEL